MREFLYVEDLADALIFLSENYSSDKIINVGSGEDLSINLLAHYIQKIIGHEGKYYFNDSYPDGTMRKIMDSSRIFDMGWTPKHSLEEGLKKTYQSFLDEKR
jgi:GDP-L-fucose synthase